MFHQQLLESFLLLLAQCISATQTKNVQPNLVQQSSDPYGIADLWDEDQHFC